MNNPYVATAVADATGVAEWLKAQFLALWTGHKTATIVVAACGFVAGCVLH